MLILSQVQIGKVLSAKLKTRTHRLGLDDDHDVAPAAQPIRVLPIVGNCWEAP